MIIETRAFARAGLLGNPSDGYFGKTISVIVKNFGAQISLYETPELHIEPRDQDLNIFKNVYDLVESVNLTGYYGATRLVKAAIKKFVEYCEENSLRLSSKNFTIRYHSSIPRQIGLAGSSAIITATFRALMQFYEVKIPKEQLPTIILSVEADELGINAGLQDRVIQVYEGCVYMDFDRAYLEKTGRGKYEIIDPNLLPQLYIAYKIDLGKISGTVLNNIRSRFDAGEKLTIDTLNEIASLAEKGKEAILNKDHAKLFELINLNFDLRSTIMKISDSNKQLVKVARNCGASAKFTGSGGSIIGMYTDDEMLKKLVVAMKSVNARIIKPYIF
ncbi:MAG: GHMP kinase [Cyclobacteriaceae bacterium]|nr:GHMP kinase [Cyclobacteriaceae bacterium]